MSRFLTTYYSFKYYPIFLIAGMLCFVSSAARADAVLDPMEPNLNLLTRESTNSGNQLIEDMYLKARALKNYSFKFNMKAFKGSKVLVESGQFYYKNPDLIRLEEKGPYKKGAVAVLGKSGKVKAHLGGGLKFIVVELAPNSHLLKSANGHPMVESDFKSLTGYLKSYIKDGMVARSTRQPVPVKGIKEKVFILDIMKRKKLWKRIAVNPRTSMPVQWWDYRDDGKLHSHATWSQFVSNRPLPDELFTIKLAKSAKKQMSDRENVSDSRNKKGKSGNSASG